MNLLKTLLSISSMTMLSRITGLARDVLINAYFGANALTDAFNTAFRIPNLLRRLFAEGAFAQAFVPILAEYKTNQGEAATKQLIDHVCTVLCWALILTAVLGILAAPMIVWLAATGMAARPAEFELTVIMTRIMFPYIAFMSLVALAGGILNSWRQFKIPAFTPVLYNLVSILATLFLAPFLAKPIYALALAVLVGGMLQLAIQIPALIKIGMLPRLSWRVGTAWQDPGVRRIAKNMVPAVMAVSAAQISILINTNIASHLAVGSISWLANADRLMEFPTALLGVALGTILLPGLSKATSSGDMHEYSSLLNWGLRLTFLLALPAAVALATIPDALTATLYHHAKFDAHAVAMTARGLVAYGVGLLGLIVVKILAPAFYARQDIRTPVKIALIVMLSTQFMNLLFVPRFSHAGLALSVGLGACVNAALLYRGLIKRKLFQLQAGWRFFMLRLFGALCLLAGTASVLAGQVNWLGLQTQPVWRAALLGGVITVSAMVYFAALYLMGFKLRDFRKTALV